jgi:signal transduction histidine kinase
VIADVGGLATDRDISVKFNDQTEAMVDGTADWLKILLRNLFVNAFKYSTPSSEVEVSLETGAGHVTLTISNDCEPIQEEHFRRLTERFYYLARADHGVGLGLSIAQRIAELHAAEMRLHSWRDGRGFRVELEFPAE